jgi:signal transduction histidine kinase
MISRQHDYPGPVEGAYARLRRHPWLADGALVAALLAGSANAYVGDVAVLPATLALVGAVAVRRRFPVAAYALALAIGTAQVIVGIGSTFTGSPLQPTFADAGILVLLYTVAARRPRRVSVPCLAACVVLFAVATARYHPGPDRGHHLLQFVLVTAVFYVLAPVSAWALGDSMAYRRAYFAGLEERAARAEAERDAQARVAAAAERGRIARELHDVIAHNLSVMVAQADGGRYAFDGDPERSRQALAEIGATGRQALSEMSHLLGVLRTGEEAPALAPAPGMAEIAQLVTQAREAGMRVTQTVQGTVRPVPGGLSLALYRMVQEALTNVRKHAGPGTAAEVTLCYGQHELLVRVADDGRGTVRAPAHLPQYGATDQPGSTTGHGLAGMRERAAMYGGTVQAGPRPGGGFEVTVLLPLTAVTPVTGPTPADEPRVGSPRVWRDAV